MGISIDHICIFGVGGTGGYFGGKIARMARSGNLTCKVYFIARGDHLKKIKKNGLILNTDQESGIVCRPHIATDSAAGIPAADICLLCVKSYDLERAVEEVSGILHDNSVIIPLLNGVDIYERIRNITEKGTVFPACVYVGSHIEEPGIVTQKGGSCTIYFGSDPHREAPDPGPIFRMFDESSIKYVWSDDPYAAIWEKFMFIAPFGLVTAGRDKTIGEVMELPELRSHVRAMMEEINNIAVKENIILPSDIIETSMNKGNYFPFETKTSLQRDVEQKSKKDERDIFSGTVIRLGRMFGISTPMTEKYHAMLPEN
jgi:2-dehydropantoate 2-reductase